MSHSSRIRTRLTDQAALVAALGDLGFAQIEQHPKPQRLLSYIGRPIREVAEIIIRQRHLSYASNDMGFHRQADGTFAAIIDYGELPSQFGTERTFLPKLNQRYTYHVLMGQLALQGLTLITTEQVGSETRLTLMASDASTVEVNIHPDGTTTMHVQGVQGQGCLALTQGLEQALGGNVVDRQFTSDYFDEGYERERDHV